MTRSTTLSVRIPYEVYNDLCDIADVNNTSLSNVVRDAISDYIELHNNHGDNYKGRNNRKGIISRIMR